MTPDRARTAGFSFIEVLIAMGVLIVGSVSVLGLFTLGVNRMVARRIEARFQQVRPEIDAYLQERVDQAKPGDLPAPIKREEAVPLSRRGYALACTFKRSPFDGAPGYLAVAELLFRGAPVRRELIVLRRSYLNLEEVTAPGGSK
jgi:hypothetical protein